MEIPFEPTRSFCYHFSRYQALPEILGSPEVLSGSPFRLIDVLKPIIDKHLTPEQQSVTVRRAESEQQEPVRRIIKGFIRILAVRTGQLMPLGDGMFRLPTVDDISEEELEDAAFRDESMDATDTDGSIYAYSFPSLVNDSGPFPIKVGRTGSDVAARIQQQCRNAATFDNPVTLGHWQVKRVRFVESAVHGVLRSRGKWRENVPGNEWFDTTMREIESIITFIVNSPS
ncbi:conserved hypothetical protein [Paraburkholderia piptadeniae]|uniref:Bacteriophage T5 Orf172 DNA-binding domain-containing protein n=1 Tax=Paraburkholderia piptadeniae TaxID=1701573 RepID=A0A1N7SV22_9BURK|nr:GIY-YIG nuclease family protein [Paraburkholderia piptadeniae]SIT51322.1 conserved hypothetical protein [Paraburkholderia piptadeniae]